VVRRHSDRTPALLLAASAADLTLLRAAAARTRGLALLAAGSWRETFALASGEDDEARHFLASLVVLAEEAVAELLLLLHLTGLLTLLAEAALALLALLALLAVLAVFALRALGLLGPLVVVDLAPRLALPEQVRCGQGGD